MQLGIRLHDMEKLTFEERVARVHEAGCGMGEMDYTEILKFMKARKPFIHATLEDTKPENNQAAKNFILQRYAEI